MIWERVVTRTAAGLALLLMTGVIVGAAATIWTSDWRWLATGILATLLGFGLGCLIAAPARKAHR